MISSVTLIYPKDMEALEKKAADIMADIAFKRLSPEKIDEVIRRLKEDVAKEKAEKNLEV